jgi:hypothetical protein
MTFRRKASLAESKTLVPRVKAVALYPPAGTLNRLKKAEMSVGNTTEKVSQNVGKHQTLMTQIGVIPMWRPSTWACIHCNFHIMSLGQLNTHQASYEGMQEPCTPSTP